MTSKPPFLAQLEPYLEAEDPEFLSAVHRVLATTLGSPSGLTPKQRSLIILSLDIAFGTPMGTRSVANLCREAGATDAEIVGVLKMSFAVAGMQRLAVGRAALNGRQ